MKCSGCLGFSPSSLQARLPHARVCIPVSGVLPSPSVLWFWYNLQHTRADFRLSKSRVMFAQSCFVYASCSKTSFSYFWAIIFWLYFQSQSNYACTSVCFLITSMKNKCPLKRCAFLSHYIKSGRAIIRLHLVYKTRNLIWFFMHSYIVE